MNNLFYNKKLVDTVGTKSENLHLMRFIAAIMVIISHAYPISTGEDVGEWFTELTNHQLTMGGFAVSLFFLCGGYLIAMSVEKNKTAVKYFKARIVRLFPSLIFVVVSCILIGSLISTWGPFGYIMSGETWKYLLNSVFISVKTLPGIFVYNPYGAVVNGSLWTLPVEFICYVLCFIAYKLTFLQKKRFPISVPLVAIGAVAVWYFGSYAPMIREVVRPVLLFYIGMGFWVYREYIELNVRYFAIAVAIGVLLFVLGLGQVAMLLCFPYIMMYIWFGMKQCSPKVGVLGNYSYGIYLWGFPVQQMIMHYRGGEKMNPLLNAAIAIPVAVVLGVITYELIENKLRSEWIQKFKCPDVFYIVALVYYSMRHVNLGLDLHDTAYSYSNFQYMGMDHMDSMWLFSTYLSNAVGHVLTKLPFGDTLLGMNVYTTLIIATLAVIGYFFCTKSLKMPRWVTFLGELMALSLCWCPSSVLYNYLTYLLLLVCVVFLYKALTTDKKWCYIVAGVCLGANVLTRFSNLPQMALIVAVWAYGYLEYSENKEKGALQRTINRTLWCLTGYLAGLGVLLGYIQIKYGIDEYINGIIRLFAMTDVAEGYTATGMLTIVFDQYAEVMPYLKMLVVCVLEGTIVWLLIELVKKEIKFVREHMMLQKTLNMVGICSSLYLFHKVIVEMFDEVLFELNYFAYTSIQKPAMLFVIISVIIVVVQCTRSKVKKEEKLAGILVLLVMIVSSLGSSNGNLSSINNMFILAPYTLWNIYRFIRYANEKQFAGATFSAWPVKGVLLGVLFILFIQCRFFGQYFFFVEGQGGQGMTAVVENNEKLEGIKMHPDRVAWLSSISQYIEDNDLKGTEVILYGHLPSLSYYLDLPPAFNSWISLMSYSVSQMEIDMDKLQKEIESGEVGTPLIITDAAYGIVADDPKWILIEEFMKKYGYECTFFNGKFLLYEATLQ